jgi:hypothetical protein
MGLLDGLIGGVVGGELASLANGLIEKHGGISGMVSELQAKGLGGAVQSWVSNGPNERSQATRSKARSDPTPSMTWPPSSVFLRIWCLRSWQRSCPKQSIT